MLTDARTDGRTDRRTDGHTDTRTDGCEHASKNAGNGGSSPDNHFSYIVIHFERILLTARAWLQTPHMNRYTYFPPHFITFIFCLIQFLPSPRKREPVIKGSLERLSPITANLAVSFRTCRALPLHRKFFFYFLTRYPNHSFRLPSFPWLFYFFLTTFYEYS